MGMSLNQVAYMSREATATGPIMRRIQRRNLPFLVVLLRSTIWPMVTSVKASTKRATIIIRPNSAAETPITSV